MKNMANNNKLVSIQNKYNSSSIDANSLKLPNVELNNQYKQEYAMMKNQSQQELKAQLEEIKRNYIPTIDDSKTIMSSDLPKSSSIRVHKNKKTQRDSIKATEHVLQESSKAPNTERIPKDNSNEMAPLDQVDETPLNLDDEQPIGDQTNDLIQQQLLEADIQLQ